MALGGIPLLVVSLDVLTQRRITRWLTDLMFTADDVQIFEPRDVIYAWVMLIFGAVFVGWGLKELFWPTKVLECTDDGLAVKLLGPLRPSSLIAWDNVRDVGGAEVDDEGDLIPLMVITVFSRSGLPDTPWGARWVEDRALGIMTQDWGRDPQVVAEDIAGYAVDAARRRKQKETASLWQEP